MCQVSLLQQIPAHAKDWFEWKVQKIGQPNQRQAEINLLLSLTQRLSVLRSLLHKDKARPRLCIARKVIRDLQEQHERM